MPTLARLASSTVTMYAADHLPPHFHVRLNDGREALVEIATLQPLTTRVAQRELAKPWHGQRQTKACWRPNGRN